MAMNAHDGADFFRFAEAALRTGITLHYAERGLDAGELPILFLHGYVDSWRSFERVMAALPAGRRAIAPDQRGHGNSGKPEGGYAEADFTEDILAFLNALELGRVHLAGHSMGSLIAQSFAARHPERVGKLILVGSAATACRNEVLREFAPCVETLEDPLDRDFVRDFQAPSNPVPADFMETIVSESMKVPAHVWRSALAGMLAADHRPLLSKVTAPTFIAWGNQDGIFTRKDQEELLERIPRAVWKEYATGHGLHWEKPEEFAADLEEFLR